MHIRSPSSKSPGSKKVPPQSKLTLGEMNLTFKSQEMVIKKSFSGTNVSIECSMYLNEKTYLVFYFLVPGISNQVKLIYPKYSKH